MQVQKKHGKGNHLIADCFGCRSRILGDKNKISEILRELTGVIEMKAIHAPLVLYHKARISSESGVTGIIILAESNITIHTYPAKNFVSVDIYSCKEFDIGAAMQYLKEKFRFKKLKKHIIKRGFY
jgi:S-adenosylmethionine decarboxylase